MFSPFSPVDIRIVNRTQGLTALESFVKDTKGLCILASEAMLKRLDLHVFVSDLLKKHEGVWLKEVPANPSVADVYHALKQLASKHIQTILAIGGGSAIDLGKALAALHGLFQENSLTEDAVRRAITEKAYLLQTDIPSLVTVPTTAGTGSEVTRWATVWDPGNRQKLSLDFAGLFPKAAMIVPEFTMTMGPELTLSTGLDALSHAMESYWAKARTTLSQALALSAIEKIHAFLPDATKPENKKNLPIREGMCLGALLAGLAFSITRTTACHAISYPLTILHNVPHGFAAAMTLDSILRRNEKAVPEIQSIRTLFEEDGGLKAWLAQTTAPVKPLLLNSFGIGREHLPAIADLSFTAGRMDNNPIMFDRQDVLSILEECL